MKIKKLTAAVLTAALAVSLMACDRSGQQSTATEQAELYGSMGSVMIAGKEFDIATTTKLILGNETTDDVLKQAAQLTNLTCLWLLDTQISDITPLSELTNLTELHLSNAQIGDITPLSKLTNLTVLDLGALRSVI